MSSLIPFIPLFLVMTALVIKGISCLTLFQKYILRKNIVTITQDTDKWKSPTELRGDTLYAWRFPNNKIGDVKLYSDGTGYYYGNVTWKLA